MFATLIDAAREAERAGAWQDALERYEEALRVLPRHGSAQDVARVLRWVGTVHRERGDLELAVEVYGASLAVAELSELTADAAAVWNCLAITAQYRGCGDEAERLYLRSRDLAERSEDLRLMAMVDQNLGTLASIRGNDAQALSSYTSALDRYRRLGDDLSAAGALTNIGKLQIRVGDLARAATSLRAAVETAEVAGDATVECYVEMNRAELYMQQQQFEQARSSCERAFAGLTRMGSKSGLGEAYRLYGRLYREIGRPHLAEVHLAQALALAQLTEDRLLEAESYAEWAAVHAENDNLREALVSLNRAHGIFRALRASRHVLRTERMMAELQPRYLRTVTAYGEEIVGASDPGIGVHARRVASYATVLGRAAGVAADDVVALRTGALLHDIGKAIVPRSVLTKPGRLTGDEWEVVKSHTVVGEDLVADLGFAWDIAPIVRHHHEHWDGSGYPDELAGEAIPLMARIVCVADVFDALTNARAYRRALAPAEALAAMGGMADSILDPGLFRVFEGLAVDGEIERAGRMAVELATP